MGEELYDKFGNSIKLPDKRWKHIVSQHPEIEPYKDKMVYTIAGHIGDGNFHIIPLMDLTREDVRAIIPELMEKVFKLVFEYQGSMSAEHNDGLIRGPYLPLMYGRDVYQLFRKIKDIFDPHNIFNPHKKVGATFKYSLDHLIT